MEYHPIDFILSLLMTVQFFGGAVFFIWDMFTDRHELGHQYGIATFFIVTGVACGYVTYILGTNL